MDRGINVAVSHVRIVIRVWTLIRLRRGSQKMKEIREKSIVRVVMEDFTDPKDTDLEAVLVRWEIPDNKRAATSVYNNPVNILWCHDHGVKFNHILTNVIKPIYVFVQKVFVFV